MRPNRKNLCFTFPFFHCTRCVKSTFLNCFVSDEYKGHSLLEGARQADLARVKKYISLEIVNFKHPYTNDTALVSPLIILHGHFCPGLAVVLSGYSSFLRQLQLASHDFAAIWHRKWRIMKFQIWLHRQIFSPESRDWYFLRYNMILIFPLQYDILTIV